MHSWSSVLRSLKKESVQDNVIRGTFKVSLTLSGRSPEPTPTKPNDLLGCCSKPRLSNRPQMPPPTRHVGSGGSYLFSSWLLNLGFEPVRASPTRGWVRERVTGGLKSSRERVTPVAGLIFETKNRAIFLESFFRERNFGRSITCLQPCSQ